MSITLRSVKGSPLTYDELDDNFTYLDGVITGGTLGLDAVLGVGNETLGNDLIISTGDTLVINGSISGLTFNNLAGTLALGNTTSGNDLTVSTGDDLIVDGTLTATAALDVNASQINIISTTQLNFDGNTTTIDSVVSNSFTAPTTTISATTTNISGTTNLNLNGAAILIANGTNEIIKSSLGGFSVGNSDKQSTIISSNNSSIGSNINSVVIGGTGISGSKDNTVYVPNLVIQSDKGIAFGTGPNQAKIELSITNWNMYVTGGGSGSASYSLAHGLSATEWKTIREIKLIVRNDADTAYYDSTFAFTSSQNILGVTSFDSTNINLAIRNASGFDSTDFNSVAGFVRGWVTLSYTPD